MESTLTDADADADADIRKDRLTERMAKQVKLHAPAASVAASLPAEAMHSRNGTASATDQVLSVVRASAPSASTKLLLETMLVP